MKFYRDLKIKNKLLFILFTMVLIVCSLSLLTLQITLNIYDEILYNESARFLNLSSDSIENELGKIEKLTYDIVTDSGIQDYLRAIKDSPQSYDKYTAMKYVIEKLMSHAVSERNVSYIIFVDTQGNQYVAGNNAVRLPEGVKQDVLDRVREREGGNVFIGPREGSRAVFAAREIRSSKNLSLDRLGTLIILVDMDTLVSQSLAKSYSDANLMILSGDKTIYTTKNMKEGAFDWNQKAQSGYNVRNIGGEEYFVTHITSENTNWVYINFISYKDVFKQIIALRNSLFAVFVVLFFGAILVSLMMAKNLTRPIDNLIMKMKKAEKGNFELEENETPGDYRLDEIGYLEKDFNIMIKKINNLIQENYVKQLAIKDVQYKALQAQINPHFLYNTLESINCLATLNRQESISMMVGSLGNLLRISISGKENVVTIDEEIKLLEYYINIQKIRYEDRLDFSMDISDDIRKCLIPKLTLQPLVENSINYGLESMLGVCRISVKADATEEGVRVAVSDNGPGIAPEILEKIRSGEMKPKGLGIGLLNIDQRIKIMFGDSFGISMESEQGRGTTVIIKLPGKGAGENV